MNRRGFLHTAVGMAAATRLRAFASGLSTSMQGRQPSEKPSPPKQDPAFVRAMQAVQTAIPVAEADPDRPVYHFRPPANWTNDPNAPFYFGGWHHLFYQLNPFESHMGNQHWGHARSRDMVNWEHLPIAIWPSTELGESAIYSGGSSFAVDGRPRLIYTSIGQRQPQQWLVLPKDEDLFSWEKYPKNPVFSQSAHLSGPISEWRDPFLFRKDNSTYMVCGGGTDKGRAQVQLYRATKGDLTGWVHLGPIFQTLDRETRNFECPNLFPLDGKWVMIVSNRDCEYWIGDLDIAAMKFEPSAHGVLDAGSSYASNISVDNKGRTLLWLWGRTDTPKGKGWGSVMTLPRILSIGPDGYLRQQPIPEIEMLRESPLTLPDRVLEKSSAIQGIRLDCGEIEATFAGNGTFGLELRRSADGKPGIVVSIQISRDGSYLNVGSSRSVVGPAERYTLRVFLDKRCIEVFVNNGATAVYDWIDAAPTDKGLAVIGQSGLESLRIWPMKNASFSLEHFHL